MSTPVIPYDPSDRVSASPFESLKMLNVSSLKSTAVEAARQATPLALPVAEIRGTAAIMYRGKLNLK